MPTDISKNSVSADKKRSLSMLMALGTLLANGARADARESRERMLRHLERAVAPADEPKVR